ncbi:hypothetical protein FQR65_LT17973 [Abscondita terminalis]|nr:hypothetical protein FQR65_LT17973 [Abscondita terminalis]
MLLMSILSSGHSLIEGLPGVAKTLTAKLIAKTINSTFRRIQFTPDLMPSDVTGSSILDLKSNEFEFRRGPIFGNIILIDEINRAPAKTQASLFECMSERQVTNPTNPNLTLGASPRASIAILEASKASAALLGRDFITPDDVKYVAPAILGHRVTLTPEKEMEGFTTEFIIKQIVDA